MGYHLAFQASRRAPCQNHFLRVDGFEGMHVPVMLDVQVLIHVYEIPTFMAFAATMRQRGAHFSGVGLGGGETGALSLLCN